ncbi:hypothetical protein H0H93_006548 [Arthromyces matolae]|nr:hypothetical protein H0H93_006548 [Arthromyces matolae]
MIKHNVKQSDSEKWVSTGDVLIAWFLKSAYALEPNPRAVVWSWVSIRPSFVGEDPAFNNYAHNGIVLCSTPALTNEELSGSVASLALRHRQVIQPVRDIAYIQAYNSLTTSIKGGLLPRQTPGEEMWCLSNQVIGHLDDLDIGSEIHAIWDWHSPMIPSNTVIFNKVGGGYIIQANIRRSRWSAISDAIDRLTVD